MCHKRYSIDYFVLLGWMDASYLFFSSAHFPLEYSFFSVCLSDFVMKLVHNQNHPMTENDLIVSVFSVYFYHIWKPQKSDKAVSMVYSTYFCKFTKL